MDHTAAALALDRIADGLYAAASHLVGPGLDYTRHGLVSASIAAGDLAHQHRAAAAREQGRDYVADLLGPDALPTTGG